MPKEWTGNLVGLMHNHKITNRMLAKELNCTDRWVSMVLNGHRSPPNAEETFTRAVNRLIQKNSQEVS